MITFDPSSTFIGHTNKQIQVHPQCVCVYVFFLCDEWIETYNKFKYGRHVFFHSSYSYSSSSSSFLFIIYGKNFVPIMMMVGGWVGATKQQKQKTKS